MASDPPSSSEPDRRVLQFRRGGAGMPAEPPAADLAKADLAKYEHNADNNDNEDYRHRMMVNAGVFLFVLALIGAAFWLADTMTQMRRDQDCVLSGRRGCTPVEFGKDGG